MSNGGLLEKAVEQQQTQVLVAEQASAPPVEANHVGAGKIATTILLFGLVPIFLVMWFGVYLDFIPLLAPVVVIASFAAVWWNLDVGVPAFASGSGINAALAGIVSGSYLVLLATPLILGNVLEGDLSMGEVEYSDDGEQITVKLRQNTLTSRDIDATVSIKQSGSVVWTGTESFSKSQSDGRGDYGSFTLDVHDFYAENALPSSPYLLTVSVDGLDMSRELDSTTLSRTVTGVEGATAGVVKKDPDRCSGDAENCLVGVVLTGWAGLEVGADSPGGMPFADFTVDAILMEGNDVAATFPTITVVNTQANWNSNNGEFGSGTAIVGDYGSEFPLDGSVAEASFGDRSYIPKEDFDSAGDYGCYSFTIEVSQDGGTTLSHTSYYEYSSSGSNEIWSTVSSC